MRTHSVFALLDLAPCPREFFQRELDLARLAESARLSSPAGRRAHTKCRLAAFARCCPLSVLIGIWRRRITTTRPSERGLAAWMLLTASPLVVSRTVGTLIPYIGANHLGLNQLRR